MQVSNTNTRLFIMQVNDTGIGLASIQFYQIQLISNLSMYYFTKLNIVLKWCAVHVQGVLSGEQSFLCISDINRQSHAEDLRENPPNGSRML